MSCGCPVNTKSDIPHDKRLDITVRVTDKTRSSKSRRGWRIKLEDTDGASVPLVLWETHDADGSRLSVGEWYRLTNVRGKDWDNTEKELHSTSDMYFERVPPPKSEPTRILHLSDTHIGYSLRDRADEYDQERVDWFDEIDCLYRFRRAMEIAVRRNVDAVLHTGDIFDDVVEREQVNSFRDVLEDTLAEADIPFCYILGNHDPEHGKMELRSLESSGIAEHLSKRDPVKIGGKVVLYGTDHKNPGWWGGTSLRFGRDVPEGAYKILCLHQSVVPVRPENGQKGEIDIETVLSNSNVEFDVLALGHEHYFYEEGNPRGYDCVAFYPGPTERISNRYRERPPFVNLYTFSEGIERERLPVS